MSEALYNCPELRKELINIMYVLTQIALKYVMINENEILKFA